MVTPSSRTWSRAVTVSAPSYRAGSRPWNWDRLCRDPVQRSSVLSVLSLNLLAIIYRLTSTIEDTCIPSSRACMWPDLPHRASAARHEVTPLKPEYLHPGFYWSKDDADDERWSYKTCHAPVRLLPPTVQHPAFLQARCPSCCPATFHGLAHHKLTWGSSIFDLDLWRPLVTLTESCQCPISCQ